MAKWRPHPKQAEFMREPPRRIVLAGGRVSYGKQLLSSAVRGVSWSGDRAEWRFGNVVVDEFSRITPELYDWLANRAKARKD